MASKSPSPSDKRLAAAQKRVAAGMRGVPGLKAEAAKLPKRVAPDTRSAELKEAQEKVAKTPAPKPRTFASRKPDPSPPQGKPIKPLKAKPAPKPKKEQDPPRLFK
jgi:hypothetical protein